MNPVISQLLNDGAASPPEGDLDSLIGGENPDPEIQIKALGCLQKQNKLSPALLKKANESPHWLVRLCAGMLGAAEVDIRGDDGRFWLEKLRVVLDADKVWGAKPFQVTRDGIDALQENLSRLDDPGKAGGLPLVAAVSTHLFAHDIEIDDREAVIEIAEDAFER
jgi:hypothetical protein